MTSQIGLYFEPLTFEDVTNIADIEKPHGIIVQLGGRDTSQNCKGLEARGFKILGTSPESIDIAEDRARFGKLDQTSGIKTAERRHCRNTRRSTGSR